MKTERLYFDDSTRLEFDATVVLTRQVGERREVLLDRTCFYPEGGGQPADSGRLGDASVSDVRDEDGAIWHVVDAAAIEAFTPGKRVAGTVDAARRFDHMQQHSGQHLLSRVFVDQLRLDTTSFHLGADACTIDLPARGLSEPQVLAAEDRAAEILREARPVAVLLGDAAAGRALRGEAQGADQFRVISIEGFDDCACGGTHVSNTAQIEAIAVRRVERINDARCRVEFVCGGRARADYRAKRERLRDLGRVFSADEPRLADAARQLIERQKQADKKIRDLAREALPGRIDRILAGAGEIHGRRLLVLAIDPATADKSELQALAQELAKREKTLAALVVPGTGAEKGQLLCSVGPDSGVAAVEWLRAVLVPIGGQGGGSNHAAQGGFPAGKGAEVQAAAEREARARLAP